MSEEKRLENIRAILAKLPNNAPAFAPKNRVRNAGVFLLTLCFVALGSIGTLAWTEGSRTVRTNSNFEELTREMARELKLSPVALRASILSSLNSEE